MKRVMVALMVLLAAGLTISASGAFGFPSSLSQLGLSGLGTSSLGQNALTSSAPASGLSGLSGFGMPVSGIGQSVPTNTLSSLVSPASSVSNSIPLSGLTQSVPSSDLQVSTPAQSAFGNGWGLNNLQFFSPSNYASAQPVGSIPNSDVEPILQMLSQLPTSSQAQQYYGQPAATATPAPNNTDTFTTNVSSTIPADQVIFLEVSKNTILKDPSNQGIIVPNVTMNYKFSDTDRKLVLKKKAGVDYNASQLYFGYSDSDDVNNRYVFDYGIGSSPGVNVEVLFHGADGRVRISVNGVQKDLMPGQKYELITDEGNTRVTLDVTNWGLVPKANINIADTI